MGAMPEPYICAECAAAVGGRGIDKLRREWPTLANALDDAFRKRTRYR